MFIWFSLACLFLLREFLHFFLSLLFYWCRAEVVSYDPLYICGVCCNFFFNSNFIESHPLWFSSQGSVVSDSGSLGPYGLQHARLLYHQLSTCLNSCPLSQWCHPTISSSFPSSLAFHLSQHQGLFQWVSSSHQVAKVLEFQLQHQSLQWTPRTDLL